MKLAASLIISSKFNVSLISLVKFGVAVILLPKFNVSPTDALKFTSHVVDTVAEKTLKKNFNTVNIKQTPN